MIQLGNVNIKAVRAFTREDWMTWGGSSKFDRDSLTVGAPWCDGVDPLVIDVEINGHDAMVVSGGESWEIYVGDLGVWTPCSNVSTKLDAASQAEMLGRLAMLRIDEKTLNQFFDWRGELSPEPFYFRDAPKEARVRTSPIEQDEDLPRRITIPDFPNAPKVAPKVAPSGFTLMTVAPGVEHRKVYTTEHTVTFTSDALDDLLRTTVGAPSSAEVEIDVRTLETTIKWKVS